MVVLINLFMVRKPNYIYKALILNTSERDVHDILSYDLLDYEKVGFLKGLDIEERYAEIVSKCGLNWVNECRRIYKASFKRMLRLKNRIQDYLSSGQCIFITLEFRNYVLDSTSEETRRKYVSRYLRSISNKYVANIDYGDRTHREHYHAVVLKDWIDDTWEYGYIWREKVRSCKDEVKLAKYVSKLTNHAIKDSTKRACYIYSRNV